MSDLAKCYALVELRCERCGAWWTRRMPVPPEVDLPSLADEAMRLHLEGMGCRGPIGARVVAAVEGVLESVLRRNRLDALRIIEMCQHEAEAVAARASLLGISVDLAAAAMYAERERREERLRLLSPLECMVGFGTTAVGGGCSANICAQPQVKFRPDRLEVPPRVAEDFLLTDVKVGKNSQLVSVGAIPMTSFVPGNHAIRLAADACPIGLFITLSVVNQNACGRYFQGVLVGHEVTGDETFRFPLPRSGMDLVGLPAELQEELRRAVEQRTWEWPLSEGSSQRLRELLRLGLVARDAEGRYLATIEGATWGGS